MGNLIGAHGAPEPGLEGTKQFSPGTKLYCHPPHWGDGYEKIVVVGKGRSSRRLITMVIPSRLVTNWRAQFVQDRRVLRRLRQGFNGASGIWSSGDEVERFAARLRATDRGVR